jgi:phage/plasmid primase-like uncharacterized protein
MSDGPSYAEIAHALNQHAEAFAQLVLGMAPTARRGGEIRFHADGKLRVRVSGPKAGRWTNFADGTHGDMIDLYMMRTGASKREAVSFAKQFLGLPDHGPAVAPLPAPDPSDADQKDADDRAKRLRAAAGIWRRTQPLHDAGRSYLAARGITLSLSDAVVRGRTIPVADLPKMGIDPALCGRRPLDAVVLAATDGAGTLRAVQQILIQDGRKAPVPNVKRTNGVLGGVAVQLAPAGPTVVLAEGPETGMSVQQATGLPTWITLGVSNYVSAPLPDETREVLIAADLEPAGNGLVAALKAADHWERQGKSAGLLLPADPASDAKVDFNDVLQQGGEEGVRARAARPWRSERPGEGGRRAVVATCPRNLLALWTAVGGRPVLARVDKEPRVVPDLHFPDDVEEILVAAPADAVPDLADVLRRRPDLQIRRLDADPGTLLQGLDVHGARWLRALAADAPAPGQQAFHRQDLLALHPDAEVLLCQTRAAADAVAPSERRIALAWNCRLPEDAFPWRALAGRTVVLVPVHAPAGYAGAAQAARQLRRHGSTLSILPWSAGIAETLRPDAEGRLHPRGRPLPEGYDLARAIADGWRGEALDRLLAQKLAL